jgi:bifunctional DNA-binding transcriptional regulator/antitoxin component of YhaV-PrlF toxin-antitoxin module
VPRLTSTGQVTIPKCIRGALSWRPGDTLTRAIRTGELVVSKSLNLDDLLGIVQVLSAHNGDPPLPEVRAGASSETRRGTRTYGHLPATHTVAETCSCGRD